MPKLDFGLALRGNGRCAEPPDRGVRSAPSAADRRRE